MSRPHLIRADTIDLQAHRAPSAQSHHRPITDGSLAPHQAETLREVAAEVAEENLRTPGVSWNPGPNDIQDLAFALDPANGGQQNGNADNMRAAAHQDALAVAQNGGVSGQDVDDADLDGDAEVDLDDDLMDKISSSPSIEDGGSTFALPTLLPAIRDPLPPRPTMCGPSPPLSVCDTGSSSPYLGCPDRSPSRREDQALRERAVALSPFVASPCRHHHHHCQDHDRRRHQRPNGEFEVDTTARDGASNGPFTVADDVDFDESLPKADQEEDGDVAADDCRNEEEVPAGEASVSERPDAGNGEMRNGNAVHGLSKPYEPVEDEDDDDDVDDDDDDGDDDDDDSDDGHGNFSSIRESRFIDSGWGGEYLQDTEDIDFDFVYALHTFVATVEGQANATKGDTMVLLDDSNSYWWLVRVVKDSSIGYLPAEHIETPTERLARLNKHRNIDLSSSMLGDQPDKARNPIKTAMKRRKTKNVQFAAPTYVDYSDVDYSTEEEGADPDASSQQQQEQQSEPSQQSQQASSDGEMEDETARVEPLKPRSLQQRQFKTDSKRQESGGDTDTSSANKAAVRAAEESSEAKADGPKKTRDGTVRDSFFKDDTLETKKITLTPNLLRDDNDVRESSEFREVRQRPSLDRLDKDGVFGRDDKRKRKDRERDRKSGGFRGFFSWKDRKARGDEDDDLYGKRPLDADAPERDIEEDEAQASSEKSGPQRQPSKLQKQPRGDPSPTRRSNSVRERERGMEVRSILSEGRINNVANVPPATMRLVESSPKGSPQEKSRDEKPGVESSPVKSASSKAARPELRPAWATVMKSHMDFDDSDTDDEETAAEPTGEAAPGPEETAQQEPRPDASQANTAPAAAPAVGSDPQRTAERLSESPVQVSPAASGNPPPLVGGSDSQGEDHVSPAASPSPELVEREETADRSGQKTSTTPSMNRPETWDDARLRAFFDSGAEVRDLLLVVYDKNNVEDVDLDHPIAGSLFREQNAKLAEITTRLDDMLGDWLARKQRLRGSV
ncbi:hypothetical protein VTH06DRAFT_3586 [Thermothelomyces fergusii]